MAGQRDADDPLREYRRRRDPARTPEPPGDRAARGPDGARGDESSAGDDTRQPPVFVIQQHDASTMHYDLRLEVDGVLASWAVPKGPSTDPRDKRLAVRTEDHPLDYADFEGTIPEGEYGGGRVIVWDLGTYVNLTTDDDGRPRSLSDGLAAGHVTMWLQGEKLQGGYALTHARLGGDEDAWLLVKVDDEAADARRRPTSTQPRSVLSGRRVEDVDSEGRR